MLPNKKYFGGWSSTSLVDLGITTTPAGCNYFSLVAEMETKWSFIEPVAADIFWIYQGEQFTYPPVLH